MNWSLMENFRYVKKCLYGSVVCNLYHKCHIIDSIDLAYMSETFNSLFELLVYFPNAWLWISILVSLSEFIVSSKKCCVL
jgi:hypothetical protein